MTRLASGVSIHLYNMPVSVNTVERLCVFVSACVCVCVHACMCVCACMRV